MVARKERRRFFLEWKRHRTSLRIQWLAVHLPMQGTQIQPLVATTEAPAREPTLHKKPPLQEVPARKLE